MRDDRSSILRFVMPTAQVAVDVEAELLRVYRRIEHMVEFLAMPFNRWYEGQDDEWRYESAGSIRCIYRQLVRDAHYLDTLVAQSNELSIQTADLRDSVRDMVRVCADFWKAAYEATQHYHRISFCNELSRREITSLQFFVDADSDANAWLCLLRKHLAVARYIVRQVHPRAFGIIHHQLERINNEPTPLAA